MTKKSFRNTVAASVLMCILAVALVIVAGGKADAATVKKYTKSVTLTMNKEQKTFNLKKYMKKGDKIKESSVDKLSLSKIRSEVYYISSKKISVWDTYEEAKNATFKIKTKKKGTLKITLKYTEKYRKSIDTDWHSDDDTDDDYGEETNDVYGYADGYTGEKTDAYKHYYRFDSKEDKDAFDTIIANGKNWLTGDRAQLEENYTELSKMTYGKAYKAKSTVNDRTLNAMILERYIQTIIPYGKSYGRWNGIEYADQYQEIPNTWTEILNGTYLGVCGESAQRIVVIARNLGFSEARYVWDTEVINHGWAQVIADDKNGEFWRGIKGSSYAIDTTLDTPLPSEWTKNPGESTNSMIHRYTYHPEY